MKKVMLLITIATLLTGGCAKIVVEKVPVNPTQKKNVEGIYYALPKTVVRVSLIVDKIEREAARYSKFVKIFAPDLPVVCKETVLDENGKLQCKDKTEYQVRQGAVLSTFGEPDPDNIYLVKFIGRGELDQSVTMTWTETGIVTGAKSSVTNRTSEIVMSGLKLAAGLGTRLAFGGAEDAKQADRCRNRSGNDAWVIPILKTVDPKVLNYLLSNYCAIDPKERDSWNQTSDEPLLKEATEAYASVVELIGFRLNALGAIPLMEPVALVQKLDGLILEKLQALFLGTKKTTPWEGTFDIRDVEKNSMPKLLTLLRINESRGFCDKAPLAPGVKPIPSDDRLNEGACSEANEVRLELSYYPAQDRQLFSIVSNYALEPEGERSFRYRIPAQVKGEVLEGKKSYGTATMSLAQLGMIASLPAKRNSKGLTYDLAYVEATGALKSFTLGTTGGIDAALIDQLSGVGNSILDARNKSLAEDQAARDKEEAAAKAEADELNVLTRRANLLKLRDQICDLLKKYGQPCDLAP